MLAIEMPFPQVGAKALLIDGHQAHPVRILQNGEGRGQRREVLVSLADRLGSSGNRRVRLADLEDATPLSPEEEKEFFALERELAGKTRPLKSKADRFERLRLRAIHADQLAAAERKAKWDLSYRRRARG